MSKEKGRRRGSAYQLTEKGVANLEWEQGPTIPTGSTVPAVMVAQQAAQRGADGAINALFAGLDGWLRCVPTDDGVVFWKWKFTAGPWAGHYVMFRSVDEQHTHSLLGLLMKVEAVRMGVARPSPDKWFGST